MKITGSKIAFISFQADDGKYYRYSREHGGVMVSPNGINGWDYAMGETSKLKAIMDAIGKYQAEREPQFLTADDREVEARVKFRLGNAMATMNARKVHLERKMRDPHCPTRDIVDYKAKSEAFSEAMDILYAESNMDPHIKSVAENSRRYVQEYVLEQIRKRFRGCWDITRGGHTAFFLDMFNRLQQW